MITSQFDDKPIKNFPTTQKIEKNQNEFSAIFDEKMISFENFDHSNANVVILVIFN